MHMHNVYVMSVTWDAGRQCILSHSLSVLACSALHASFLLSPSTNHGNKMLEEFFAERLGEEIGDLIGG